MAVLSIFSRIALVASATTLIAACTTPTNENGVPLTESPSYQAGYGDGCASATEEDKSFSTKKVRDAYLFDNDRAYAAGWRQGYLSCGDKRPENESNGGLILGEESRY